MHALPQLKFPRLAAVPLQFAMQGPGPQSTVPDVHAEVPLHVTLQWARLAQKSTALSQASVIVHSRSQLPSGGHAIFAPAHAPAPWH